MRTTFAIIGALLLLLLGLFIGTRFASSWFPTQRTSNQTVLLNEMRDVMKLITVEGYFSEVYDYKDYYYADWKPFTKKALVRVQAKVSVGYDMEAVTFRADESSKTIVIENMPDPEILSLDHDIDYYDIQQGAFNTFTEDDYNKLNKGAKDFIKAQVADSPLYERAAKQRDHIINMLVQLAGDSDYEIVIAKEPQQHLD